MVETFTITRHAIRNYGSVLQACATQTLIRNAGSECTTIDYRQPGITDTARGYRARQPGATGLARDLAYRAFRARGARARGAIFEHFLRSRLRLTPLSYHSYESLAKHTWPTDALYCVGSDQVWNLEANGDNRPYYLCFAPAGTRKFSLASSIGLSRLPATEESALREALHEFDGVSVREAEAAGYLVSLGLKADWHVDPTLALPSRDWREFAGGIPGRRKPYVLVYQLNHDPLLQKAALAVGRTLGLPVVRVEYWQTFRGFRAHTIMRPSVERFVALIRDASVLVSDSFHGAALALNLGTRLVSWRPRQYGGRLDSLLAQFGIEDARASSIGEAIDAARFFEGPVDLAARLRGEQERVQQYLASMVGPRAEHTGSGSRL